MVSARARKRTSAKKATAAKPAGKAAKVEAPDLSKAKSKLVRDSFTIPKSEYQVLEALKVRASNLKRPTRKSELIRAGIALLDALSDGAFLKAVARVPSLKTGRPKLEA